VTQRFFQSRYALWLALPAGAALALGFASFDLWLVAILCFTYLFLAWRDAAPRRAAQLGFLFTAGVYLAGTYWLYHSIHEIGHAPLWLTLFIMLALVAIMSAYSAFVGYALARWLPSRAPQHEAIRFMLILPAAWTLLEWFRGWFLSGFPWLALGYTHIDTPLAGFAPVGGVYSMSFIVAVCAGAIATLIVGATRARIAAVAVVAVLWAAGLVLSKQSWTHTVDKPVTVAIVQGAVPQEMKWDAEQRDATIDLYRNLTRPHLGTNIIVWPEAALPGLVHELTDVLQAQWGAAREKNSDLVLGQVRYDFDTKLYYNAVLALSDKVEWYEKRRLVPFAEIFPAVPKWARDWLRGMDLPYSGFKAGERNQPALDAGGQKLALTICYEDAYGAEQLEVLKTATLLVNVTNDAWFGDSTAAHQHLQISRMRALEAGRPLLRAANDGISAIIAADGKVEKTLPRFVPGVLSAAVQPRSGLTPYAHAGNWPVILLCFLALVVAAAHPALERARAGRWKSARPASAESAQTPSSR
jgi:apolipoprotein N-acyltransferase